MNPLIQSGAMRVLLLATGFSVGSCSGQEPTPLRVHASIEVTPQSLDFGEAGVGSVVFRSATLTNRGPTAVTISGIVLSGFEFASSRKGGPQKCLSAHRRFSKSSLYRVLQARSEGQCSS